ncbi:uncharacterized protein LOC115088192 isoform X2 [Rhinatrema bivittatum]|nr:uncharacterized protein LOC115088192 isoform X2 [Rhinatrema bivittatum]XP_029452078.1 uncharacterized protein LOC115088192 isoform X2 [Rhinatrema bivittatum]
MMLLWILCTVLGLSLLVSISLAQSGEEIPVDTGSGFIAEEMMVRTQESKSHSSNSMDCSLTFFTPGPSACCKGKDEPPASQEELAYLKDLIQDTNRIIQSLQYTISSEAGLLSYQDIISEALTGIREDNQEFYKNLNKVIHDFHTKMEDDNPDTSEEKKKLRKDFLMMDHLLKMTSRIAEQIDTASQDVDRVLTRHIEKSTLLTYRSM